MKLRKKQLNKNYTQSKIKEIYLRKLSLELIKRGISNKTIKSTLDEVALSLEEFISETKPKNMEDLEKSFGTIEQFCENNMLVHSSEGILGQVISLLFIILSTLAIPSLGLAGFFLYPFRWIIASSREVVYGVSLANLGAGFLGTLFGLNMCIWLLYQYYKDRFSPYDFREKIKFVILGLYWFIVCLWLIQALLPYTLFSELIADIWSEGLKYPVIEGAIRWILMGIFLVLTAAIYTSKIDKTKSFKKQNKTKNFWIDDLKVIFIFYILTGFIIPNPGIGIFIIVSGLGVIFFSNINEDTWIWGLLALLTQIFVLTEYAQMITYGDNTQIVFGIKATFFFNRDIWRSIILSAAIILIWITIGLILLRKRKKKIFPRFTLPSRSNIVKTCALLIIIIFATLGSQPQYTKYGKRFDIYNVPEPIGELVVVDIDYNIETRGTIYLSFYTYFGRRDKYDTVQNWKGNWSIRWITHDKTVITYEGDFDDEPATAFSVNKTGGFYMYKIDLTYIIIKTENQGNLEVHYELDYRSVFYFLPVLDILIVSKVSWFPSWIEIFVVAATILSLFLSWEKKKVIKLSNNSKEERR